LTKGSLVFIGNAHPGFNQATGKERINGKTAVAKIIWVLGLTVSSLGLTSGRHLEPAIVGPSGCGILFLLWPMPLNYASGGINAWDA